MPDHPLDFDTIWARWVKPLAGTPITGMDGLTNEIRSVDSDGVVKTLMQRGLVEASGAGGGGAGTGAAYLFEVSDEFLEKMGLRSVDELPPLADFMPDAEAVEDMEAKLSPNA